MAQINPNIISDAHPQAQEKAHEWAKSDIFEDLNLNIRESEIMEVFPDARQDVEACQRYMRRMENEADIEEESQEILSLVNKAQSAWDEIFGLQKANSSDTNSSVFRRDLQYSRDSERGYDKCMDHLRGELRRTAPGYYIDDRSVVDADGNEIEQERLLQIIDENLLVVYNALLELSEMPAKLAKKWSEKHGDVDDQQGDVDDQNQSEDQEFYGHA